MNRRRTLQNIIGLASLFLLIALFCMVSPKIGRMTENEKKKTSSNIDAELYFDSEELRYDGVGILDLMEGVHARSADGKDLTDKVNATITSDGTLGRKTVRYMLIDDDCQISKKRTLVMENYRGPTLEVMSQLRLRADDLDDLINVLHESGLLSASDGYGADITGQVTCLREHQAGSEYKMTFRVINSYLDETEQTVKAHIYGEVKDPVIKLSQTELMLPLNSEFQPLSIVAFADDGSGNTAYDRIRIETSLNTAVPGSYRVAYELYSTDKTAKTTEVLKVKVLSGDNK